MELQPQPISLKKIAFINGCILSVVNIVIMLFVFYVMPNLMAHALLIGIQLFIGIGFVIYLSLDMRSKRGGYWAFKEAVSGIFIMLFTSALITFGYTLLFGNLIDPSYPIKLKEVAIAKSTEVINKMNTDLDQNQLAEANAIIDVQFEKRFDPTLIDIFQDVCFMAIIYFIVSLVFAAILKKEKTTSTIFTPDQE